MNYHTSIILQHSANQNPLDAVIAWFSQSQSQKYTNESIINKTNILLLNQEGESIKIADIRELKEKLSYGTYTKNTVQYFILLHADKLTVPAQNALLKSIEEPPKNTHIILATPNPDSLLATIRSRCTITKIKNADQKVSTEEQLKSTEHQNEIAELYKKITTASQAEQIEIAAEYKDRVDAQLLCRQLIEYLHGELIATKKIYSTRQIATHSQKLLSALELLDQNLNVLLVLENCFFDLK